MVDNERQEIVEGEPAIILSTSGMLTGGNSVEYFKQLCGDERNSSGLCRISSRRIAW